MAAAVAFRLHDEAVVVLLVALFFAALIALVIGLVAGRAYDGRWKPLWKLILPSVPVVAGLVGLYAKYLWELAHAP